METPVDCRQLQAMLNTPLVSQTGSSEEERTVAMLFVKLKSEGPY